MGATNGTEFIKPLERIILDNVASDILDCKDEQNLVYLDSDPMDQALHSAPCEIYAKDAVQCVVVLAYMTLGFKDPRVIESERQILSSIQNIIGMDLLNSSDVAPNIVNITYVGPEVKGEGGEFVSIKSRNREYRTGAFAISSFASFSLILIIVLAGKAEVRKRNENLSSTGKPVRTITVTNSEMETDSEVTIEHVDCLDDFGIEKND